MTQKNLATARASHGDPVTVTESPDLNIPDVRRSDGVSIVPQHHAAVGVAAWPGNSVSRRGLMNMLVSAAAVAAAVPTAAAADTLQSFIVAELLPPPETHEIWSGFAIDGAGQRWTFGATGEGDLIFAYQEQPGQLWLRTAAPEVLHDEVRRSVRNYLPPIPDPIFAKIEAHKVARAKADAENEAYNQLDEEQIKTISQAEAKGEPKPFERMNNPAYNAAEEHWIDAEDVRDVAMLDFVLTIPTTGRGLKAMIEHFIAEEGKPGEDWASNETGKLLTSVHLAAGGFPRLCVVPPSVDAATSGDPIFAANRSSSQSA
jgi:hypothetical protein